jgi:hypothetical protein
VDLGSRQENVEDKDDHEKGHENPHDREEPACSLRLLLLGAALVSREALAASPLLSASGVTGVGHRVSHFGARASF